MAPSIWQLLIVLVIIVLIFGTKRLRNIGTDLGSAVKGFKKSATDTEAEDEAAALQKKDAADTDASKDK